MKRSKYIPNKDEAKTTWLHNFTSKIGTYAATVGLTPADVTDLIAAYNFWAFVMDAKNQWTQFVQTWTAYKNALRDGGPLGGVPSDEVVVTAQPY